MRKTWCLFGIITLLGCSHDDRRVEEHAVVWERRVAGELPRGTDRAKVEAWAGKNSVVLANETQNGQRGVLEILPGDGLVCAKWHIELRLNYSQTGRLESASVKKLGVCL
jgi:hypothetical protein